jgi:NAD(P)-dependent dehydrogenase (short-subunit alcohol dehydrogenase family)
MPMDLELRGRTVLITGASKGIGRACAEGFAAEGTALDLVARSAADLEQAADELRETHSVKVRTHALDLSRSADQRELADRLDAVDIVVNNAGAVPAGDVSRLDEETWRRAWDLKIFGYINLTRLLLPRLEHQSSGVIVNVIGTSALRPTPDFIAVSSGNAALDVFTRALGSNSLKRGVRVLGVHPGLILTDRLISQARLYAEAKLGDAERWREMIPAETPPGTPDQVADVVVFLASARASHLSGIVVPVDGGSTAA